MLLIADVNEQSTNPHIVDLMRIHFPNIAVSSLAFGDFNVILDNGDILAIERKEVGDFLGSVGDGRVFRQVEQMAQGSKFSCIIMIGGMKFDREDMVVVNNRVTGWRGKSVRAAMTAIQFSGCPIIWCSSDEAFPQAVMEVIEFATRPVEHLQLHRRRVVTFPPVELSLEILASFPGVGLKRAQALMEFVANTEYNSLGGALAWASAFPLLSEGSRPEGWGNKSVANLRGMLGLGDGQYLEIKEEAKKNGRRK